MVNAARRSGRRTFLLLAAIFFVPLIFAWLMHFNVISWRPHGSSANGEIVTPVLSVPHYEPQFIAGGATADDFLRNKWNLLFIGDDRCDQACQQALILMRQVRLSLGKYHDRIGRVYVTASSAQIDDDFLQAFAGMQIVQRDQHMLNILDHLDVTPGESIFLVDPLGNVMMRYPSDQEPRPMYEDMKHLLKLSRIG